jgi:hypothetical protein
MFKIKVIFQILNLNICSIDVSRTKARKKSMDKSTVGKQTHDLTVSDSKTTQSGGDNRKRFETRFWLI